VASPLHASLKLSDSLSRLGLTLKLSLSVSLISLSWCERRGKKKKKGAGDVLVIKKKKKITQKKSLRALTMAYEYLIIHI
jgi:hypothetical protein